ncbi:hypothetical protein NEIRO03_2785, partial [Nematocida sp. AWRm78]
FFMIIIKVTESAYKENKSSVLKEINKIINKELTGQYIISNTHTAEVKVSRVNTTGDISHTGDIYEEGDMYIQPEYFTKNIPYKPEEPDNDELPPPGINKKGFYGL